MPFDQVAAERGARVSEGQRLGTLAATGDRSSTEQHLHVGLRRGSLYLDPLTLLSPPAAGDESIAEPEPAEETVAQSEAPVPASTEVADPIPAITIEAAASPETNPATAYSTAPVSATSVSRIPEIAPSAGRRGADSLSVSAYGGDVKLLEGIKHVLGSRVSPSAVLMTLFCALTGLLACFRAVRAMARRTTPDESPNDTPARKVAAAAGRW